MGFFINIANINLMKMKFKNLLVVGCFALFHAAGYSQAKLIEKVKKQGKEIVIPYEKYQLANGLTVIVHEDHSDPVVHVDVTYHVGSGREEIGKSGFAHFFEHMMFQGSDHVGDEQHFKIVTESGGTLNGSTNRDRTNYYETVPSNQLEKMLWLEADRMGFLLDAVTQKKFEVQRSTVKNERGQNYENRPYGLASETTSRNLYPYGHPYSWLTIGYVEDLNRVNVNDLKNFFLRWYGPNNATLTVGGDIKTSEVVQLAEKYFGSIPRGPEVNSKPLQPVNIDKNRYVSYVDNYARLPLFSMVFPTVPNYHKDMAALACLAQVIGQGRNSVLYQQLVKPQLAYQASANSQLSELAGEFSISAMGNPGKSLAAMESYIRASLDSFEKRGITDDDIQKFKGGMESQLVNGLQSVSGKVSQLAAFQTFTGNPNKISDLLAMYASLTKEDVQRVYETYIKGKPAVILSVLPKGQDSLIAASNNFAPDTSNYQAPDYGYAGLKYTKATDKFDRSKQPGNGLNPVVKVPSFWKEELGNGVKVIGSENTELPIITMSLTLQGGHLLQARDTSKAGLASMFATMMNDDTKFRTAEQMAVALQKLGSSVSVSSSLDGIVFTVQSLKKNIDSTLALLRERILFPSFNAKEFKRYQKQALESIKIARTQPATVADAVFARIKYGNSILAIDEDGTESSVANLSVTDVEDYYKNHIGRQRARLVIVGDIKKSEILSKLKFLDELPDKKTDMPALTNPEIAVAKTKIYLVDIPKAAQTEFRVGYNTGLKYDATGEFYRAGLMNFTLGGGFNSRLNINLREDKGWTYGARSSFNSDKYAGDFVFSSGIRADATDSALKEVMNELTTFSSSGIKPDELVFLKKAIGQRDALKYETAFQKAGFVSRMLEYNLPADYVDQQNMILQKITKPEIDALAKKWIRPDQINILLVGDKARILPGLEKLGYEIEELNTNGDPISKKAF